MAAASVYVMELDDEIYKKNTQPMLSHINVGTGVESSIREMAETMALVVGYDGKIVFDITKPDGSPRKLMDVTRLENLGWKYRYNLKQGLELTYKWFINNLDSFRS